MKTVTQGSKLSVPAEALRGPEPTLSPVPFHLPVLGHVTQVVRDERVVANHWISLEIKKSMKQKK